MEECSKFGEHKMGKSCSRYSQELLQVLEAGQVFKSKKMSENSFSHSLICGDFVESTNASDKNLSLKNVINMSLQIWAAMYLCIGQAQYAIIMQLNYQFSKFHVTVFPSPAYSTSVHAHCVPCEIKHFIIQTRVFYRKIYLSLNS